MNCLVMDKYLWDEIAERSYPRKLILRLNFFAIRIEENRFMIVKDRFEGKHNAIVDQETIDQRIQKCKEWYGGK